MLTRIKHPLCQLLAILNETIFFRDPPIEILVLCLCTSIITINYFYIRYIFFFSFYLAILWASNFSLAV
jgi:hypothetical protein